MDPSSRRSAFGDVAVVDTSSGTRCCRCRDRRSREVLQALTGADLDEPRGLLRSPMGKWPAPGLQSRAPAAPARTASTSSSPPQSALEGLAGDPAGGRATPASSRPAWTRSTRCASRPAWRLLRRRHRRDDDRARGGPRVDRRAGTRASSAGGPRSPSRRRRGSSRRLVGFEMVDRAIAGHGMRRVRRRREGGSRHERGRDPAS